MSLLYQYNVPTIDWTIKGIKLYSDNSQNLVLDASSNPNYNILFSKNNSKKVVVGSSIDPSNSNVYTNSCALTVGTQDSSSNTSINCYGTYYSDGVSAMRIPADTSNNRPPGQLGYLRLNTTISLIEYWNNNSASWSIINGPLPLLTSIQPSVVTQPNFDISLNGNFFSNGSTVTFIDSFNNSFSSPVVTYINSNLVYARTPSEPLSLSGSPFDVKITNRSGFSSTLSDALTTGSAPFFNTAAGSLGDIFTTYQNFTNDLTTITAQDADGDNITLKFSSGSIPPGLSFNSTFNNITKIASGTFSGTVSPIPSANTNTTYNFQIDASSANALTNRSFTITVYGPYTVAYTYTGSNQSFSKPSTYLKSLRFKMWGSGGGSGQTSSATKCGGAGGYVDGSLNITSLSTLTLVVGKGGSYNGFSSPSTLGAYSSGSGGGYAGIFNGPSASFASVLAVAGGGGGSGGSSGTEAGYGGAGGGTTGGDGENDTRTPSGIQTQGRGGSQVAGGIAGSNAYGIGDQAAGSALTGGRGSGANVGGGSNQILPTPFNSDSTVPYGGGGQGGSQTGIGNWCGGGGGAGFYGGGGGAQGYAGGGGGGSSFIELLYISNSTNTQGANGSSTPANPPNTGDTNYVAGIGRGTNNAAGGNARIVFLY